MLKNARYSVADCLQLNFLLSSRGSLDTQTLVEKYPDTSAGFTVLHKHEYAVK